MFFDCSGAEKFTHIVSCSASARRPELANCRKKCGLSVFTFPSLWPRHWFSQRNGTGRLPHVCTSFHRLCATMSASTVSSGSDACPPLVRFQSLTRDEGEINRVLLVRQLERNSAFISCDATIWAALGFHSRPVHISSKSFQSLKHESAVQRDRYPLPRHSAIRLSIAGSCQ